MSAKLVVVTATASARLFQNFRVALEHHAHDPHTPIVAVGQGVAPMEMRNGVLDHHGDFLGVVPAFARGVELALRTYPDAEVIACLHDDVLMDEHNWDRQLLQHFDTHPNCGLAGFGGAWGLGDEQAGQGTYRPTWLVRRGFMSNMQDAEVHGTRVTTPRRIAVLDGFSLVFRRQFLRGFHPRTHNGWYRQYGTDLHDNLFSWLAHCGVVHHAYDAAMGALAKEMHWETWLLPFACHHLGGQTAVGDAQYATWAMQQAPAGGDQVFWEEAHRIVWAKLGHLLPFEVDRP